jgi:hypothetical protein
MSDVAMNFPIGLAIVAAIAGAVLMLLPRRKDRGQGISSDEIFILGIAWSVVGLEMLFKSS